MIIAMEFGQIKNKKSVREFFLLLKDGKYLLQVDNNKKRTLPQNSFLHGILIPEFKNALNSVGYDEVKTNGQAKLIMKSMFLTRETVNKETGEMIKYVQDTSDLTTVELNTLIDEVIKFTAENMNYTIPFPNEQLQMNY
jgi:hypothetical protein